jgi:hypothetical protein
MEPVHCCVNIVVTVWGLEIVVLGASTPTRMRWVSLRETGPQSPKWSALEVQPLSVRLVGRPATVKMFKADAQRQLTLNPRLACCLGFGSNFLAPRGKMPPCDSRTWTRW